MAMSDVSTSHVLHASARLTVAEATYNVANAWYVNLLRDLGSNRSKADPPEHVSISCVPPPPRIEQSKTAQFIAAG